MHIHIHIHIYTYTHIHIYTYVRISGWVSGGSRGVPGWFSGGSREVLGGFSGGSRVVLGVVLAHKTYSKPRNSHARSVYKKTGMETGANFA